MRASATRYAVRRAARTAFFAVTLVVSFTVTACQSDGKTTAVIFTSTEWKTGRKVSTSDMRGSAILMSSWATWCEPCKRELPELQKFYAERRADGLEVVAVNVNVEGPSESKIDPMISEFSLSMPMWRDADDDFTSTFDGLGVPMTVLIGADGTLLRTWQGEIDTSDRDFLDAVNSALREASTS